jgi:4a-hydroxytetrahydrobiopterin dehydratase
MENLSKLQCEACRPDSPAVTAEERARFLPQIPGWSVVERDGVERLERTFRFPAYRQAVDFTLRVANLAEAAGHHPAILLEWGRVTVGWWTHSIGGLHRNDFILAARTDETSHH